MPRDLVRNLAYFKGCVASIEEAIKEETRHDLLKIMLDARKFARTRVRRIERMKGIGRL